ncbi:MmcB family DNA repair protein [Aureibacillus halotolerans]|uniref:MmcB family DNA repair protein n=1 Tax=Aureibacillus halotolerans TaxID=1508390 RepID=UPI001AADBC5F
MITVYEIKVSRSDFLRDDKWPAYKNQCHRFFFVCPKDLIKPEELPDEVVRAKRKGEFKEVDMNFNLLWGII